MILLEGVEIKPTIFPDKTSQVWKLPEEVLQKVKLYKQVNIEWRFENESELIHLLQLEDLIKSYHTCCNLYLPYLPYARQDKKTSNESTFALRTFLKLLCGFIEITIFDPHSKKILNEYKYTNFNIIEPTKEIEFAYKDSESNMVCYPDYGAEVRYRKSQVNFITLDKDRDQSTGEIKGLKINNGDKYIKGMDILIIDDICDGGRTFIEATKLLYSNGAKSVNLYVSHGIFSKGIEVLREVGIKKIYTKDGLYE